MTSLVLAEDAYLRPLVAGAAVLNGLGDCTGLATIRESGMLETPVWLTSTMQLGRVYDAACEIELARHPEVADDVCIPVVGECDDSFLNDCRRMWVTADDVARGARGGAGLARLGRAARTRAAVGSGTGMSCLGFKGGIGTSSRVTPGGHTVAVLLMTNFGDRERLTVDGVPVGRLLAGWHVPEPGQSPPAPASASSSPTRRSTRPAASGWPGGSGSGLARTGSVAYHGSGEIFLAASTTARTDRDGAQLDTGPRLAGRQLDDLFAAVVDAAEESVLNSLLMSPTTIGRDGNESRGARPRGRPTARRGAPCRALSSPSGSRWPTASSWRRRCSSPTAGEPQPCLLEALPYRKDDLTSSYAESYRRLRDTYGYAVCRVDLRGTGSSAR